MKAMVLSDPASLDEVTTDPGGHAAEPLTMSDVPVPVPGPGQVRMRVTACGVCRTDLHLVEGDLPLHRCPIVPGHQIVGRVDATGTGVNSWSPGDRVGAAWLGRTCENCAVCRSGRENLCRDARFTGYDFDGGYAEYVVAQAGYVYRLPPALGDIDAAPLLCAGIIGYRALRLSGAGAEHRLGLYGFGASAHITIQVARHLGCEVYVFSRSEAHRRLARDMGAAWCGPADEQPPAELDASILFAPAGTLVPPALEHLGRGGTLVLAGIHLSQIPPLDYEKHLYYERSMQSVTASTRSDGTELLKLAAEIPIRTRTTAYDLAEANTALRRLKAGMIDGAAVLTVAPS